MIDYKVIRSKRKTLVISINESGDVIVKSPISVSDSKIDSFVNSHQKWILKKQEKVKNSISYQISNIDNSKLDLLKKTTYDIVLPLVEHYSRVMGCTYNKISITSAKKRFGSCNSIKNLSFSFRLCLYPMQCIEYVVVHELAHLKELNHSTKFYKIVEKYYPNYKEAEQLLNNL